MTKIICIQGNIVDQDTDAIVNAASKTLLGGGGVDAAIHEAAGPQLLEECKTLGGCATAEAKLTKGYNLKAKYVIHTVGPVFGEEKGQEPYLLALCYANCLRLAADNGIKTISFPAISTGAFSYPKNAAAKIAISTARLFIRHNPEALEEIRFVLHSSDDLNLYNTLCEEK